MALSCLLKDSDVTSVLIGASKPEQILSNIAILLTKIRKPPAHMTDAHLGESPLFVGLRRLLSELRTKLARVACSNSGSPF